MPACHAPELPIDQLAEGCLGNWRGPMTWGHTPSDKKSREAEAPQHAGDGHLDRHLVVQWSHAGLNRGPYGY